MRALKLVLLPLLLLAVGCVVRLDGWDGSNLFVSGHSVEERDGALIVDDVRLDYDRWVDVAASVGGLERLELATATDAIELDGEAGGECRLQVRLYSEHPEDGVVELVDGKLEPRSHAGGKLFINSIRGSIPEHLALRVSTGTGDIALRGVAAGAALEIATGTGYMTVHDNRSEALEVDTGTGDLLIEGGLGGSLEVESGTGSVKVRDARFESVRVASGTGDLLLEQCEIDLAVMSSGTGNLIVRGGECRDAQLDSGTGDVMIRDGAKVNRRD
jgi:hypothetical protein